MLPAEVVSNPALWQVEDVICLSSCPRNSLSKANGCVF
jgi:hypothetical protein